MASIVTRFLGSIQRLISGAYLTVDPALATGQEHYLRCNSKAILLVDPSGSTLITMQAEQTAKAASFAYMAALVGQKLAIVAVRESTGGNPATGAVRAGAVVGAPVVAYFSLNAGDAEFFSFPDVDAAAGVYVQITSGTVDISVGTR